MCIVPYKSAFYYYISAHYKRSEVKTFSPN
nr:MAG TPA: hypothetical protein [Caudoviricetes sp.]DAH33202.1 MAG TPA: hypothetical protein [Caudoviricetes sp.]